MKIDDGYIQYLEDWYGFYKSIETRNNNNDWLIDFALEHLQEKLSHLYYQKQNIHIDNTILDLPKMNTPIPNHSSIEYPTSNGII